MRELTKSMLRFSWALPIFGVKQMIRLSVPTGCNQDSTAQALDAVSAAAQDELGDTLKGVYDAGDRLQHSLVDTAFGVLLLDAFDPRRWLPGCNSKPAQPLAPPPVVQPPITPSTGSGQTQAGPTAPAPAAPATAAPAPASPTPHEPGWGPMP